MNENVKEPDNGNLGAKDKSEIIWAMLEAAYLLYLSRYFTMENSGLPHPYVSSRSIWNKKKLVKAEKIFAECLSKFLDNNY